MGMIYDRRQATVGSIRLSMIRANEDLHIHSPSTGEVVYYDAEDAEDGVDEIQQDLWMGHAAYAGDALRYAETALEMGYTIDDVFNGFYPFEDYVQVAAMLPPLPTFHGAVPRKVEPPTFPQHGLGCECRFCAHG